MLKLEAGVTTRYKIRLQQYLIVVPFHPIITSNEQFYSLLVVGTYTDCSTRPYASNPC